MAEAGKYASAQQAIVQAIDQDSFDTMHLGLLLYPTGNEPIPSTAQCPAIFHGFPVTCRVSGLAQVAPRQAGTEKSNTGGVRRSIYDALAASSPNVTGVGDGNPTYLALDTGIRLLQGLAFNGKRILLYITDGGASCAALSHRNAYRDANGCNDWENPDNIVELLEKANEGTSGVDTFVVGVPGASTDGSDPAREPPYRVRNALSAYAFAGSPKGVDPACDGKKYTQGGQDPAAPCHFDMTKNNYSAASLAKAIDQIRGKFLGCVFELPQPSEGKVDTGKVNVEYTAPGGGAKLKRRSDKSDACEGDGCWDYTGDGRVELVGKACTDVKGNSEAQVKIVVGCTTVVK
jgi:hypothetical protein